MRVSLQVMYPITESTSFDHEYYVNTHLALVAEHMGKHIETTQVTKGVAGGPDTPPSFYAVATMVFANQAAMDAAMENSGPVLSDIPNFYNARPTVLIGVVTA